MLEEIKYFHRPYTRDLHLAQEKREIIYDKKIKINPNNFSLQNKENVSEFKRFHYLQNYKTKVHVRIKSMNRAKCIGQLLLFKSQVLQNVEYYYIRVQDN